MRPVLVVTAAAIMVAAVPVEALARHKQLAHPHASKPVLNAQASAAPQTTSLGGMRYYGGPKSPMWREVK